ncbi:MAG: F0F1 ATP synthase subunit A [Clostridia bacterium]|nr:F0F1 ATP synthase subunit A [Clostridia bacterium]
MALKVLFTPAEEGISISGALVFLEIPLPLMPLQITEALVNSWAVIIAVLGLCLFLTRHLSVRPAGKRQLIAEWVVEKVSNLVNENMGPALKAFAPYIAAILAISALSSLSSLLGLYPPTADISIIAGWAIMTFLLITHYKLKVGLWGYVKGFFEPIPFFAPLNIIGEVATPLSMSFRHYGNVLSGVVVSTLIASALRGLSAQLLGWLPGALGGVPFLQIGLPAVLSLYFDLFSGCMQAFIFAMLTMLFVATAGPEEE